MVSAEDRFARSEDVETSPAGDRVVLYHRRSKNAVVLNPTGSWVWEQLQDPASLAALVAEMSRRYPGVAVDQVERDLTVLLDDLKRHGMLETRP